MQGVCIRIFTSEATRHHGKLLVEWLLEEAKSLEIPGATVFRGIAGYGRHRVVHEETFFELAGELPVEIEIVAPEAQIEQLLARIRQEKLQVFYVRFPAEYGVINGSPNYPR